MFWYVTTCLVLAVGVPIVITITAILYMTRARRRRYVPEPPRIEPMIKPLPPKRPRRDLPSGSPAYACTAPKPEVAVADPALVAKAKVLKFERSEAAAKRMLRRRQRQ